MADTDRKKDIVWAVDSSHMGTVKNECFVCAVVSILMDIRDELKRINGD